MSELGTMALRFLGQASSRNGVGVEFVFNSFNSGVSIHSNREGMHGQVVGTQHGGCHDLQHVVCWS